MGLPGLLRNVGIIALIAGVIGFLLPGEFIFFPALNDFLVTFGESVSKGISHNEGILMIFAKAPAIFLGLAGLGLIFIGTIMDLMGQMGEKEPAPADAASDTDAYIKEMVRKEKGTDKVSADAKKSVHDLAGDRKQY
jgi:hypothetical protein